MTEREDGLIAAGAKLRKWRDSKGITQAAAAEKIRASQGAWAAWERGDKGPDLHSAFRLAELTEHEVEAEDWAFPRKGSRAADATGPQQVVTAADAEDIKRAAGS